MITDHMYSPRKLDDAKSPQSSKPQPVKRSSRIKARMLTRFERKVLTQSLARLGNNRTVAKAQSPSPLLSVSMKMKSTPNSVDPDSSAMTNGPSLWTKKAPTQGSSQREPSPSPSPVAATLRKSDSHSSTPSSVGSNKVATSKQWSYSEPISYPVEYMRCPAKPTAKVYFCPSVTVKEIPSHRSYDPESRKKLWSTHKEIEMNAVRNKIEYAADKRDWKSCTEEDQMVVLEGKLVHPETYTRLQRHQQKKAGQKLLAKGVSGSSGGVVSRVAGSIRMKRLRAAKVLKPRPSLSIIPCQRPLQDSSNLAAKCSTKRIVARDAVSVLDFPTLPAAPSTKRSTQDHPRKREDVEKATPVRRTPRSSKFTVRRRPNLFRLPTRTARKELEAMRTEGLACQAS